ncbi:MAG: efflux RND transporter permease subunit [Fibrobacter sp.]|jgi:HAE1 family hydrophobic/amphiphilic exporter-1|nr:efflux RND transporter permease subunit [Fibrobacter sp.]
MIKASIYKPITMLMVILAVVVFGIYTYRMMAVDMLPKFEVPVVTATVIYQGASPEELESTVIKPVEEQVELIDGIDYVLAYAMENYAIFVVMFNMGVNVDVAANDVRDKIAQVQTNFPDAVEDAIIQKVDINGMPIVDLAFVGQANSTELRQMADEVLKPKLSAVSGVASVDLFGGTEREISIEFNKEALQARNVDIATVMSLIGAANLSFPFGDLEGKIKNTSVRADSKFRSLDEIRNLEIPTSAGRIRLSEIAVVKDTVKTITSTSRYQGINSIGMSIKKRTDANVVQVADGVLKAVERINKDLPEGYELNLVYDRSDMIRQSVDGVISNIYLAIILTAIILLLFLGKFSTMFIAAVTMPISVVGAFTFMYFSGFTINIMTLMALSSAVGLLVTNSIVILENISVKLESGLKPKEAALVGTSEIMIAIMASTLTNVCVFVPIAFMKSVAGIMFRSYGLTMVYATFVSLLITFTLTPLMAAYLFKAKKMNEDGTPVKPKVTLFKKIADIFPKTLLFIQNLYLRSLAFCLSRVGTIVQVLIVGALIILTALTALKFMTVEMMPKTDEGFINITLEMPSGTNIETTDSVAKTVEARVKTIPELKLYYSSIGGDQGLTAVNQATVKLSLKSIDEGRVRTTDQIVDSLRVVLADIPDAYITIKSSSASEMGNGQEGDVVLEVRSLDGDSAAKAANIAISYIRKIPGVVEVKSSYEAGKPEMVFHPNRAALADYGMTAQAIANIGYFYVSGYQASTYTDAGEEYDIYIRLREEDRADREAILNLPILTPKGYMPIQALYDVETRLGPTMLTRKYKKRLVEVSMNLLPGYTTGGIMGEIGKIIPSFENVPPGVEFAFGGNADMQQDMITEFIAAIIMAILLTYILMVALLESFSQPFIILTTIPMGAIGVIFSLVITRKSLSMIAFMAIVMLIGVVVNNAILLLDEANRRFRSGNVGRRSAILKAAEIKFQPILLATFAAIVAQIPLALGIGGSVAAMTQPMGIASVGGLLISAILTMYLIPTFFWLPNALFSKAKKQTDKLKTATSKIVKRFPK